MKRFIGWVLVLTGAVATAWGGYLMLTGASEAIMRPLPVSGMTGGLAGVACLTLGLIWARD